MENTMKRRDFLATTAAAFVLPVIPAPAATVVPIDWFDPHRYSDGSGGYRDCDICSASACEGCFTDNGRPTQMYRTTDALPYTPIDVCQKCVDAGRHLEW